MNNLEVAILRADNTVDSFGFESTDMRAVLFSTLRQTRPDDRSLCIGLDLPVDKWKEGR